MRKENFEIFLLTSVCDAADEVDAVLLDLLVPVLEDGREARQQVLDGRGHLRHPDHLRRQVNKSCEL